MKKIISVLILLATMISFENKVSAQTTSPLLRHIVMITFKQDASADSIKALDDIYETLSKNLQVKDFEMGVNFSPRDSGVIKHIYVTTFASKDDMDSYKKIPLYSRLFKISLPLADDVTVADYWVKK
jgi:Stress responsive A/B Barrel Domain